MMDHCKFIVIYSRKIGRVLYERTATPYVKSYSHTILSPYSMISPDFLFTPRSSANQIFIHQDVLRSMANKIWPAKGVVYTQRTDRGLVQVSAPVGSCAKFGGTSIKWLPSPAEVHNLQVTADDGGRAAGDEARVGGMTAVGVAMGIGIGSDCGRSWAAGELGHGGGASARGRRRCLRHLVLR